MRCRVVGLLCVLVAGAATASANGLLRPTLDSIKDARTVAVEGVPLLSGRLLSEFYAERGDLLVWVDPERIRELSDLVQRSVSDGFRPEDFHAGSLQRLGSPGELDSLSGNERIAADLLLSDALA
jgi:hypothetical protein